jgi:hypothetical protein
MAGGIQPYRKPRYTNAHFAEEQRICYELYLAGHNLREIAELTGLSKTTVSRRLECEIRETVDPLREQYRRVQHDRLERLFNRAVEIIRTPHPLVSDGRVVRGPDGVPLEDPGVTLAAIGRAESLVGRMMRLHGTEGALKVDATLTETTQQDLELIDMVNKAKADAALAEARLKGGVDGS